MINYIEQIDEDGLVRLSLLRTCKCGRCPKNRRRGY